MNLRDFVKQTLVDVTAGIRSAQSDEENGCFIAPSGIGGHDFPPDSGVNHQARIVSTVVKFDVAVSVASNLKGSVEAQGKIIVAQGNLEGAAERKDEQASRIQFSVPLMIPPNQRDWG